jgi:hypothetical protein
MTAPAVCSGKSGAKRERKKMAEPTTTTAAVATLAAACATIPALSAFGINLGLHANLLIAGFAGSLVAIVLLNTVPSTGDTWRELLRLSMRRTMVAVASALTAGYVTPLALLVANVPETLMLSGAFAVGGGAQHVLTFVIRRLSGQTPPTNGAPEAGA